MRGAGKVRRDERLLHATRDLQVARHLLVHAPQLVLIVLHPQQRAEPREEHLGVGAFGDEIVGAGAESVDDVLRRVGAGQHQHRNRAQLLVGLHAARDFEAVHDRHPVVDDDGVGNDLDRQRASPSSPDVAGTTS